MLSAALALSLRRVWLSAPLLPGAVFAWLLFLFFGAFALAEIPLMVFALRKMAREESPATRRVAVLLNGVFVFFAAVYALPNLLLAETRFVWLGLALAATAFLRFGASLLFVPVAPPPMNR